MSAGQKPKRSPVLLAVIIIAVVIIGAVLLLRKFLATPVQPQKKVAQEIQIIRPPAPPPDLKPPPPPPPEEKVDLPQPKPEPTPMDNSHDPPPGDQLGVDATGTGGGDAFGLVGRPGGRDLLASSGSGSFGWYGNIIKTQILDGLDNEPRARKGAYTVNVRIWVKRDGGVERAEMVGSSGNTERDEAIRNALAHLSKISQPPPTDMPQPINLKIVSRS